jgi:hypothetical protein
MKREYVAEDSRLNPRRSVSRGLPTSQSIETSWGELYSGVLANSGLFSRYLPINYASDFRFHADVCARCKELQLLARI